MSYVTSLKSEELSRSRPNPQKRSLLVQRISRAPWWLLLILFGVLLFAIEVADRTLYAQAWEGIKSNLHITIRVTFAAYSIAIVLGLLLAVLRRRSKSLLYNTLVYQPATVFVEVVRGVPTLVLLLYIVAALVPELVKQGNILGDKMLDQGIDLFGIAEYIKTLRLRQIRPEWRAIAALAIAYSAFLSEVFRAGLESISKGQRDAARSLGMSNGQVMSLVVFPQAFRIILPPLGNDLIAMLKDSSLVSAVGVTDITREAQTVNAASFTLFPAYNVLAVTYLVLTLGLSIIVKGIEFYVNRGRDSGS